MERSGDRQLLCGDSFAVQPVDNRFDPIDRTGDHGLQGRIVIGEAYATTCREIFLQLLAR